MTIEAGTAATICIGDPGVRFKHDDSATMPQEPFDEERQAMPEPTGNRTIQDPDYNEEKYGLSFEEIPTDHPFFSLFQQPVERRRVMLVTIPADAGRFTDSGRSLWDEASHEQLREVLWPVLLRRLTGQIHKRNRIVEPALFESLDDGGHNFYVVTSRQMVGTMKRFIAQQTLHTGRMDRGVSVEQMLEVAPRRVHM